MPGNSKVVVGQVLTMMSDKTTLAEIREGYKVDPYTNRLLEDEKSKMLPDRVELHDGLLFVKERLIVSRYKALRESLFRLAHDELGHFEVDKSYASLCFSYYWPNM